MSFSNEEIQEFFAEARDLLEVAEKKLLSLDSGGDFTSCYDAVFRSFHNLKGGAAMMELERLNAHIHELETLLTTFKDQKNMPLHYVNFFLKGIDAAREIMDGGSCDFSYIVEEDCAPQKPQDTADKEPAIALSESPLPFSEESYQEFLSECDEIFARLQSYLRMYEEKSFTADTIHSLYRDIHSFKGAAFLFSFQDMGEIAHVVESCLEPQRESSQIPSSLFINELYHAIDLLENSLEEKKKNPHHRMSEEEITAATQQLLRVPAEMPEEAKVSVKANTEAPGVAKEGDGNTSIRVPVNLLDRLMTLMGEMVLVRNQVLQFSSKSEDLDFLNLSQRLNVVTSEIQGEMMKTRLQPIGNITNKFYRVVRDLSGELGKEITLQISGSETELDKSLLEAVKDPLTHIIRNACDHGIEHVAQRRQAGKAEQGTIHVNSYHEGGQIVIEVNDDGQGLHRERLLKKSLEKGLITESQAGVMSEKDIFQLIFLPGFSTASAVTNLSGRGVGMDVVRTNVEKIGGTVDLQSVPGKGTQIKLKIPLTLAIVPALIVEGAGNTYAIPQVKLLELVRVDSSSETQIEFLQNTPVYRLRGEILPLVYLDAVLGGDRQYQPSEVTNIAVLKAENFCFGLIVETIRDTADIVVKPLNRLLKSLNAYSGATILGDGSVALILDPSGIAKIAKMQTALQKDVVSEAQTQEIAAEAQEFLVLALNSPTKHAILLNYIHRLEEFPSSAIEWSGQQKVVRYRNSILPIISANKVLGYPEAEETHSMLNVVVVERAGRLYGIEVNGIIDILVATAEMQGEFKKRSGIIGSLSLPEELIVVLDPVEIILSYFPEEKAQSNVTPIAALQGKKRVLLVEDTSFFRRHVKKILEKEGYDVECATDGTEALRALKDLTFDLIISDIEMPKMNGFQLAREVRKLKHISHIPMMALSTKFDVQYCREGKEAGFDRYLEKINAQDLLLAIQQLTSEMRGSA